MTLLLFFYLFIWRPALFPIGQQRYGREAFGAKAASPSQTAALSQDLCRRERLPWVVRGRE